MAKMRVLLPNPLVKPDGSRVTSPEQWPEQAAYIRQLAQEHMYGTWPAKADGVETLSKSTKPICEGRGIREDLTLEVTYQGFRFPVDAFLSYPTDRETYPALILSLGTGWRMEDGGNERLFIENGYAVMAFDRPMVYPNHLLTEEDRSRYPQWPCGCIMAWGWMQSTLVDWLEKEHPECKEKISAGHSRGGKAALSAAIFDERFCVAAPMGSGCGGAGCARYLGTMDGSRQDPARCETIGKLTFKFPHWFIPKYSEYGMTEPPYAVSEREEALPLDGHFLRAAVAPRAVFNSEGETDGWSNPFGTQMCYQAAQPVFDLLGVPERNGFHMRSSGHEVNTSDWVALMDFCNLVLGRERTMPQPALNKLVFDINVDDYMDV